MDVIPCMPATLLEIYGPVLPCTSVISVETFVHMLTQVSMNVLLRASLLVPLCVRAHAPAIIRDCGGCYSCLSVVLSNILHSETFGESKFPIRSPAARKLITNHPRRQERYIPRLRIRLQQGNILHSLLKLAGNYSTPPLLTGYDRVQIHQ